MPALEVPGFGHRAQHNYPVASLVPLNFISPSKLSAELELFRHQVWEALDIGEVLFLCEQHSVDLVVIAAEVEHGELIERELRGVVMRLDKRADAGVCGWGTIAAISQKGHSPSSDETVDESGTSGHERCLSLDFHLFQDSENQESAAFARSTILPGNICCRSARG